MRQDLSESGEFELWMKRNHNKDSDWVPVLFIEKGVRPTYIPRSHLGSRKPTKWKIFSSLVVITFSILYFGSYIFGAI